MCAGDDGIRVKQSKDYNRTQLRSSHAIFVDLKEQSMTKVTASGQEGREEMDE